MNETNKNERLRRIRASQSSSQYIRGLRKNPTVVKVKEVLDNTDLSKDEKSALIRKAGNLQLKELERGLKKRAPKYFGYKKVVEENNDSDMRTIEEQFKDLEELLDSPILSFKQKKDTLDAIRRAFVWNLDDASDGLDCLFESILFTEEEKTSVLFNLDEVQKGGFKVSEVELESFVKILKKRNSKDEADQEA